MMDRDSIILILFSSLAAGLAAKVSR